MNAPRPRVLAALAVLAAGCGAQADIPQLCNTLSDQQLVGTGTSASESRAFTADFSTVTQDLTGDKLRTQLFLTDVSLTAGQGLQNFDFIDSADLFLTPTGGQPVLLLHYARSGATSTTLKLSLDSPTDLLSVVPGGKFQVRVDFQGKIPAGAWSLGAQACVHAHAEATL